MKLLLLSTPGTKNKWHPVMTHTMNTVRTNTVSLPQDDIGKYEAKEGFNRSAEALAAEACL